MMDPTWLMTQEAPRAFPFDYGTRGALAPKSAFVATCRRRFWLRAARAATAARGGASPRVYKLSRLPPARCEAQHLFSIQHSHRAKASVLVTRDALMGKPWLTMGRPVH